MSKLYESMAQLEKENSQLKEKVCSTEFLEQFVDFLLCIISITRRFKMRNSMSSVTLFSSKYSYTDMHVLHENDALQVSYSLSPRIDFSLVHSWSRFVFFSVRFSRRKIGIKTDFISR